MFSGMRTCASGDAAQKMMIAMYFRISKYGGVAVSGTRTFRLGALVICCFGVLLVLYTMFFQLVDMTGCVFFRNPGARELLLVPAGCDPPV